MFPQQARTTAELQLSYTGKYEYTSPDWINVIAITRDGRFLLERQYRHGLQWTGYELCAGVCEQGETPLQAAQRELYEETGYGKGTWTPFLTISANPGTMTNLCHTFLATDVEPVSTQHLEPSEDISLHLLTTDEVRGLLVDGHIRQALMAAPLWKFFAEHHLI